MRYLFLLISLFIIQTSLIAQSKELIAELTKDNLDVEVFEQKAIQKTKDLTIYIGIITNVDNETTEVNDAINLACQLFVDEKTSTVEVSSVNTGLKKKYPVRRYLERLKQLPYDKIEIEWTKIYYTSKFRKGADGKYYGVVTFAQKFTGLIDEEIAYIDSTTKNVEIVLAKKDVMDTNGNLIYTWDLLLSDIGVTQTKKVRK